MHPSDKATLRLTLGLGLATLIAYGMALTAPYFVCVLAVILLSKPGPALPLIKGIIVALLFAGLVAVGIVFPHGDEVLGADDQGFVTEIVFKHSGQRGGHDGFSQAHHVADHHATTAVQMAGGNLDGAFLELE